MKVDKNTYSRAFELAGGYRSLCLFVAFQLFTIAMEKYRQYMNTQWTFQSSEEQQEQMWNHAMFVLKTTLLSTAISYIQDLFQDKA